MSTEELNNDAAATAKDRFTDALEVAESWNKKPYTRIPHSKSCVRILGDLMKSWSEKDYSVREELLDMEGVPPENAAEWSTEINRVGFTKVSDAGVNFIDYLCKEEIGIFDFEERGNSFLTKSAQIISGTFPFLLLFIILFSCLFRSILHCSPEKIRTRCSL